jgi:hypothetical protein
MVRYDTQSDAPHLVIELDDAVCGDEVRRELGDLPDVLSSRPDDFVMMAVYPDLTLLKTGAVGSLFYFVAHIFDADPGLCVFVDGGQPHHPGLRTFIKQVGLDDQVAFVPTREEATTHIQQHVQSQDEGG